MAHCGWCDLFSTFPLFCYPPHYLPDGILAGHCRAQCFYAFGQLPGIDVAATKLYANDATRIAGTFGNAPIFALYLIFQTFFAVMLFFWERDTWRRVVLVGIFLINGMAIFFSGTRGAILGMYAGLGLIALGQVLFSGNHNLRLGGAVALVLMVAFLGGLYALRASKGWCQNSSPI